MKSTSDRDRLRDGRYSLDMYWGMDRKPSTVQFLIKDGILYADRAPREPITDYLRTWVINNPSLRRVD